MTANRSSLTEWELPSGGLAEEIAAQEATTPERNEAEAPVASPATLAEVEFLFLTPDEQTEQSVDASGPTLVAEFDDADESSNQPRTVEEALASDFLFAFDQREADDDSDAEVDQDSSFKTDDASPSADEGSETEPPTNDRFSLTSLQAEREQLEREIGNLRRELERHRTMLLELRESQSLLLPAPTNRRLGDGNRLPATADVLAGLTTVAEPLADFRDSEEFRSALPKASALLGVETADDGTLLQAVDGDEEPNFRALAPIDRPRGQAPAIANSSERSFLPALRPLSTMASDAEVNDVKTPIKRPMNEIMIPVRWWNAIPFFAFFVLLSAGVGAVAIGAVGQVAAKAALEDALHSSPVRVADLESALAQEDGTFLSRFDGRFDYIRARVQDFVNVKINSQELLSTRRLIDPRIIKLVDRAVERTPALGWHRLTRAALATAVKADDAETAWKTADAGRIDAALYWEMLGDHYRMIGRQDDAIEMFANVLRRKPTASRDVLAMLAEVRVDLTKSLEIIPPTPIAALQATLFVRNEEGRRNWREHAERLVLRLGAPKPSEDGDDLAARGQLHLLLLRNDDAAASYELALKRDPERNDFRLALAKLRYDQKRFDECGRLVERIIHSDPASNFGEEARVLRNKIELVTSGRRAGSASVAH
jgi:tetratricopeptide (TPR) repeat protein